MVPSATISPNAATVAENVGKARLMGTRPAISHAPQTRAMDASRHNRMLWRLRAASPGSAASCAATGSSSLASISRMLPVLLPDLRQRLVQRLEGPEVLDLEAGGIAFDLAGQRI